MNTLNLSAWSAIAAEVGNVRRLLVGFSGGVDSTVLLFLARQWSAQSGLPVLALHINHQLSPHALAWQQHCHTLCEQWGIPFRSESVSVINSGLGLEAAARNARYEVFERVAETGDLLLLGHHRDDQVETVMLRWIRGSGVLGLRGMDRFAAWRHAHILRPLLSYSKTQLLEFASAQTWQWVEDESNHNTGFDRNYLRHQVLPLFEARWPHFAGVIERSAHHCHEAQQLLDERAHEDLLPRVLDNGGLQLTKDDLPTLSLPRQRNLLRYWLRCQQLSVPSETRLDQILHSMIPAADDAAPLVSWSGVDIRRYRQALYAVPLLSELPGDSILLDGLTANSLTANALTTRTLSSGGNLIISQQQGRNALRLSLLEQAVVVQTTKPQVSVRPPRLINLRFRQGGERCKLAGRSTRPLKKILQDAALPPWWRDRLPLVYLDDTLVAIPGIGVCEGYEAQAGETGLRIDWQTPSLPQAWRLK